HRLERHRRPAAVPHLLEHAIDIAMQHLDLTTQALERTLIASPREKTAGPAPRNDVSSCHRHLLSSVCVLMRTAPEARARVVFSVSITLTPCVRRFDTNFHLRDHGELAPISSRLPSAHRTSRSMRLSEPTVAADEACQLFGICEWTGGRLVSILAPPLFSVFVEADVCFQVEIRASFRRRRHRGRSR